MRKIWGRRLLVLLRLTHKMGLLTFRTYVCSIWTAAEIAILPRGEPESRETSTGRSGVPHTLNCNHMLDLIPNAIWMTWIKSIQHLIKIIGHWMNCGWARGWGAPWLASASHYWSDCVFFTASALSDWLFAFEYNSLCLTHTDTRDVRTDNNTPLLLLERHNWLPPWAALCQ